jgi:hypothetical protein
MSGLFFANNQHGGNAAVRAIAIVIAWITGG